MYSQSSLIMLTYTKRRTFGYIQKFENEPNPQSQNKKLTLLKLSTFINTQLMSCFGKIHILKFKNNSKTDIFINDRGVFSIQIFKQSYSTIMHHTHRQNFCSQIFKLTYFGISLS